MFDVLVFPGFLCLWEFFTFLMFKKSAFQILFQTKRESQVPIRSQDFALISPDLTLYHRTSP